MPLFFEIQLIKPRIAETEKMLKSIRARQVHTSIPHNGDRITDNDIVRARAVPLETLVPDLNRVQKINCPYHDDKKPSFYVKGFGYCFSCGAWADSIKWLMDIEHRSFVETVKILARR